jgi:hypothetical protein
MFLARPETREEAGALLVLANRYAQNNYFQLGRHPFIDGITKTGKSCDDWYFGFTDRKYSYPIAWQVNQPDFNGRNELCMSLLGEVSDKLYKYNDVPCQGLVGTFICEDKK